MENQNQITRDFWAVIVRIYREIIDTRYYGYVRVQNKATMI